MFSFSYSHFKAKLNKLDIDFFCDIVRKQRKKRKLVEGR